MKKLFFLTVNLFLFSSCATILSSTSQRVNFTTEPPNAKVYINNVEVGKTPLLKDLKRNGNYLVKIDLEGYKPFEINLKRKFNPIVLANILLGGIVGLIVDIATGAMYVISPDEIDIYLKDNKIAISPEKNKSVYIHVALSSNKKYMNESNRVGFLEALNAKK